METPKVPVNPQVARRDVPPSVHVQEPVTIQDAQDVQRQGLAPGSGPRATSIPAAPAMPDPGARRHRVYMDDPHFPVDPNADVALPLSTVHMLLRQLGDLQTTINRQPFGPGQFGMEIIMLQNKLATPGFNPTPQDMDAIHHQVVDLSTRVAGLNQPPQDPLWVTEGDIETRFVELTATANRVPSPQKEALLHDIQSVRQRKANMTVPYTQVNLDAMNTESLELAKRVEAEAGRQHV